MTLSVACIQHDICWEDPPATFEHLGPMIAGAADAGARLVVLTEMFSTGFSMAAERIAEPPDGPSTEFLCAQAVRHGTWLAGSIPMFDVPGEKPANVLTLADPDGGLHRYAKIHPFGYAGEHDHYRAGTETAVVDIAGVRLGLFVCYDLRFGDDWWPLAPHVDAYLVVANWPAARRRHWQTLLLARAIENQAYVIGCNRVGTDGNGLPYAGDSAIVDPLGEVLTEPAETETVLYGAVDPMLVAEVRARFPFLPDRRTGAP
jgi:predicted amidohydrolase